MPVPAKRRLRLSISLQILIRLPSSLMILIGTLVSFFKLCDDNWTLYKRQCQIYQGQETHNHSQMRGQTIMVYLNVNTTLKSSRWYTMAWQDKKRISRLSPCSPRTSSQIHPPMGDSQWSFNYIPQPKYRANLKIVSQHSYSAWSPRSRSQTPQVNETQEYSKTTASSWPWLIPSTCSSIISSKGHTVEHHLVENDLKEGSKNIQ